MVINKTVLRNNVLVPFFFLFLLSFSFSFFSSQKLQLAGTKELPSVRSTSDPTMVRNIILKVTDENVLCS